MRRIKHLIILSFILCGCATSKKGSIDWSESGKISFSGDRPFKATLEKSSEGEIKASLDMKGEPLINVGNFPDVKIDKK